MPSSFTRYVCDICNKTHQTKEEAIKCEEEHYEPVEIKKYYYNNNFKCQYPERLVIEFKNKKGIKKNINYVRG